MKNRTILFSFLCIVLASGQMAEAAPKKKTKYTNLKAQAVSDILDMLHEEKEQKIEDEAMAAEKAEQEAKEEAYQTYLNPKTSPVQVAPRVVPEEKKQIMHSNSNGSGIGKVGGIGEVGSPNVKSY